MLQNRLIDRILLSSLEVLDRVGRAAAAQPRRSAIGVALSQAAVLVQPGSAGLERNHREAPLGSA